MKRELKAEKHTAQEIRKSGGRRHYPMPVEKRAKQFMPFAAVTGLEPALRMKEAEMGYDASAGTGRGTDKGR